jgi:hypothetical protein
MQGATLRQSGVVALRQRYAALRVQNAERAIAIAKVATNAMRESRGDRIEYPHHMPTWYGTQGSWRLRILSFGTKSTIDGVVVGTILCDATVLSRGSEVFP